MATISGRSLTWNKTVYNVSGYGVGVVGAEWSTFMNDNAISFIPDSSTPAEFNGQSYSGTADVILPRPGVYKIKVAADNKDQSSATFGGQSLSIGNFTDDGFENSYRVETNETTPKTVTLSIVIGNEDSPNEPQNFAENPMGMAILITEPDTLLETEGADLTCSPGPWSSTIPTCAAIPTPSKNLGSGLQISKSGNSSVDLNLKNYANKLVTLKVVHEKKGDWENGFSFNIPQASDILAGGSELGGSPYNRLEFSKSDKNKTTTIFYLCNLDGGNYNYTFTHSSNPDPAPTRDLEELTSEEEERIDEEGNFVIKTVYSCKPSGTETYSPWPPCLVGVTITENGGNQVRWVYEDGGGGGADQIVTITVEDEHVRDVIPQSGEICMTDIKNQVWIADPQNNSANGNCLSEYDDHSEKTRFRIPSIRSSKTTLPDPLCFTDFRGVAGAPTPDELGIP